MFQFIKRKVIGDRFERMDNKLAKSFNSVDKDLANMKEWIIHLHTRHGLLESAHKNEILLKKKDVEHLTNWVNYLHKHSNQVYNQVSSLQQFTLLLSEKLNSLTEKVKELEANKAVHQVRTEPEPGSEPNLNPNQPQTGWNRFEERMLTHHIRPNRKNYVLKEIVNNIQEQELTTKQLERLIVKEKGLCGRTSFYAYLKELKDKGALNSAGIGSKNVLISNKEQ